MAYRKVAYWSNDDNAYIVEVPALPGCMADGQTLEEAFANADITIREWIDFAKELGRTIPPEDYPCMED